MRRTVRTVRKEGRRSNNRTEKKIHRFMVWFRRGRWACCLPCLIRGFGDNRQGMSGSRGLGLTIFINSMSGRKSLTSFAYRFFHFSRLPGLKLSFDAAERNGRFGRVQCQRSKESSSRQKRKKQVFLCRRTVRVEVKSKVVPTSFLKIVGRVSFVQEEERRKGRHSIELVGN